MAGPPPISRREFVASGTIAAALALVGCGSQSTAHTAATSQSATPAASRSPDAPSRVAYCACINQGRWTGPRDADGAPSQALVDAILQKRRGDAEPMYMRMTSAAPSGTQLPARGTTELSILQRLARAGIHLGVAVDVYPNGGGDRHASTGGGAGDGRTVEGIVAQAKQIRAAGDAVGGIYDWIFLDHAQLRTPAGGMGVDDLQQVVDGVSAAGWPRVMINASGFNDHHLSDLPQRTWAMARHSDLLGPSGWQSAVQKVVSSGSGAVQSSDLTFVDYVHRSRPGATPLLKLEIPSQTQRFRRLSADDQGMLLRLWAQQSHAHGFRVIYPLYVDGEPSGDQQTQLDSLTTGTFWEQRSLMQRYG